MNEPQNVKIWSGIDERTDRTLDSSQHDELRLAVVVPFLNEARFLPAMLGSIEAQTCLPSRLMLIDDGSTDGSYEIALSFAERHRFATALRRPPRPPEPDRLARAAELVAFNWGLEQIDTPHDIVVKLDADLQLTPTHFAEIVEAFERDVKLGVAGAYLSTIGPGGTLVRQRHPANHVPGPNKFYRRECLEEIAPLPAYLGWDTIDEVSARMRGWHTRAVELRDEDSVHLRPTGQHDGRLRAFRRWGECAYGCGSHPLHVIAGGMSRARQPPFLIGGMAYVAGWFYAQVRNRPRVGAEVRTFKRKEELRRLRHLGREG